MFKPLVLTLTLLLTNIEPLFISLVLTLEIILRTSRSNKTKQKHNLDNSNNIKGMPNKKILHTIIVLINQINKHFNKEEQALLLEIIKDNILILMLYYKAINYLTYSKMQLEAIKEELCVLLENKTQKEVFLLSRVNLINIKQVFIVKHNLDKTIKWFKA